MRTSVLALMTLLAGACGSDAPDACAIDGRYRIVAHESRGDCGPLPDQVQSSHDSAVGCMMGSYQAGREDDQECVVSYGRTCRSPDGSTVRIGVSVQREEDGDTWTGAMDAELFDVTGQSLCHSLYFLTLIRE